MDSYPSGPRIARNMLIDSSSLETNQVKPSEFSHLDVDIGFLLDVRKFPGAKGTLSHQIVIIAEEVRPRIIDAEIEVSHVTDLGILRFSAKEPDWEDDVICRVELGEDYWTSTISLRQIWQTLTREIGRYEKLSLLPPVVEERRRVRIAVNGIDYFNAFISPDINELPRIYHSQCKEILRIENRPLKTTMPPPPPALFR